MRYRGFFITMMLLLPLAMSARAADCTKLCKEVDEIKKPADVNHVIVDANTGALSRQRFDETTDRVQVIFVNKNPFKRSYKFSVVSKPLDQGIIEDGLKLLGITAVPELGVAPPPTFVCVPGPNPKEFEDAVKAVKEKDNALNAAVKSLSDASKKYDEFVALTDKDPVKCETVCEPANQLLPHLKTLREGLALAQKALTDLEKAIEAAKTARTKLDAEINTKVSVAQDKQQCLASVQSEMKLVEAVEKKISEYSAQIAKVEKAQKQFEQLQRVIENLSASSFVETADAFSAGGPTDVTITITPTDFATGTEKQPIVRHLQFGESPFSISAGLGWTTIEAPRLIRQRAPKEGSTTEIVEVFGEENNSNIQPMLIGQMNVRLGPKFNVFHTWPAAFGVSAGAVLADSTDTMDSAYHAGISFVLANNSFVVTLAYHSAVVSHLASGFKIGDPIPSTIQDPLPQEKDREGGFMIGITYRTR